MAIIVAEFVALNLSHPWLFSSWKEIMVVLIPTREGCGKKAAGLDHFLLEVME